jgi:hypothetical protein
VNKAISTILLLVTILTSSNQLIKSWEFLLFRSYIIQELCIEKEVEDSCCKGKCFVNGEKEESDAEKGKAIPLSLKTEIENEKSDRIESGEIANKHYRSNALIGCLKTNYSYKFITEIFHPPQNIL